MKYDARAVAQQIRTAMIHHTHFLSRGGTKRQREVYGIVIGFITTDTGLEIMIRNSDKSERVFWTMPRTDRMAVVAAFDQIMAEEAEKDQQGAFEFEELWEEDLKAADATWNLQHPPCSTCGCSTFSGNCPTCDAPVA
jgi:hypothetical protein